jgi:hypothetical protein
MPSSALIDIIIMKTKENQPSKSNEAESRTDGLTVSFFEDELKEYMVESELEKAYKVKN